MPKRTVWVNYYPHLPGYGMYHSYRPSGIYTIKPAYRIKIIPKVNQS